MGIMKRWLGKAIRTAANLFQGNGLSQDSNFVEGDAPVAVHAEDVLRRAAADGTVLLRNQGDVLPLSPTVRVALFGRCQCDWFYVGYGSGGDVNAPYRIDLIDATAGRLAIDEQLAARYRRWCASTRHRPDEGWWGAWPRSFPEMPIAERDIARLAASNDVAVMVIGRSSGEDRENVLEKGAYYLTDKEKQLLARLRAHFKRLVIVLDIGNIIEISELDAYSPDAVLIAFFGGQESCRALVDVLTGEVSPSGKLTDTVAKRYSMYPSASCFGGKAYNEYREDIYVGYRYFETFRPEDVLYPFGYGLSYTRFTYAVRSAAGGADGASVEVEVRNEGDRAGREVVQLYLEAPVGRMGHSARSLVAFAKTPLLAPHESAVVRLACDAYAMASFDDVGTTGYPYAYVLEAGRYILHAGVSVRDVETACVFVIPSTVCVKQLQSVCVVERPFQRLRAVEKAGKIDVAYEDIPSVPNDLRARILRGLPSEVQQSDTSFTWRDVCESRATVEQFARQLDMDELEALTRGQGFINSPYGTSGNCGSIGGVTEKLRGRGLPAVITDDGPSGLRLHRICNLVPSGVCLASTWDPETVRAVYDVMGREMLANDVHVLLGPGQNIHRNPLCGRNFEYLSEDPLLSGSIAAAMVEGVQTHGVAACVKHFCCNNQEYCRNSNDSRLSQRALREIYLKSFEISVTLAKPWCLMASYNLVNGVWSHYHYELTHILRDEWGYDGLIMTDWWMKHDASHEFPSLTDNAYRVRAGVDVYMPGSFNHTERVYRADPSLLATYGQPQGILRAEIERCAVQTLRLALRLYHVLPPL